MINYLFDTESGEFTISSSHITNQIGSYFAAFNLYGRKTSIDTFSLSRVTGLFESLCVRNMKTPFHTA